MMLITVDHYRYFITDFAIMHNIFAIVFDRYMQSFIDLLEFEHGTDVSQVSTDLIDRYVPYCTLLYMHTIHVHVSVIRNSINYRGTVALSCYVNSYACYF